MNPIGEITTIPKLLNAIEDSADSPLDHPT